jgi:Desulfoferrodoxin, N-terminal domain
MTEAKAGQRFQCPACGTQVVVIKTDGQPPRCCGADMESSSARPARPAPQG